MMQHLVDVDVVDILIPTVTALSCPVDTILLGVARWLPLAHSQTHDQDAPNS
jgi:hypothetical protein